MEASDGSPVAYNVTSGNDDIMSTFSLFQYVVNICNMYIIPFIIVTGIAGNIISFIAFICSTLSRQSTSVYLAALAFSDTGFLVCVGIGWMENIQVEINYSNGMCQMLVWSTYIFSFMSVWYVVCFTTEMYLAIFHSNIGRKLCKPRKARIVVCSLFLFACVFYMYSFWSAKSVEVRGKVFCLPFTESRNVLIGLTFADTTITLLLPFSLLIFMNARILILIMGVYNKKTGEDGRGSSGCEPSTDSGPPGGDQQSAKNASKAQKKTTKMLVIVAVVFLLLNLPSHAVRAQSLFRSLFQSGYVTTEMEVLLQQLAQILYCTNFAINFVIYNACAKSFRRAVLRLPGMIICCTCVDEYEAVRQPRPQNTRRIRRYENDRFQNSRLVEVHMSEMHLSQMQSFAPEFVCRSPPCFIKDTTV